MRVKDSVLSNLSELSQQTEWTNLAQATKIFQAILTPALLLIYAQVARSRVYNLTSAEQKTESKRLKYNFVQDNPYARMNAKVQTNPTTQQYSVILEQNPKWKILDEILLEISRTLRASFVDTYDKTCQLYRRDEVQC